MPVSATRRLGSSPKLDIKTPTLYIPLWRPDMVARGGSIVNGTGTMDVSPQALAVGANTITVTAAGTLIVSMPEGGTVASGTMTVTGSPVTISAGIATTITTTGATGNITATPSNIIRSKDKNNYAMTITGALWTSQGRTSDGDDWITVPAKVTPGLTALSMFAWLKPTDSSASYHVLSDYTSNTDVSAVLRVTDVPATTKWACEAGLTGAATAWSLAGGSRSDLAYGTWYFVGFTWDGTTRAFYVDGVSAGVAGFSDTALLGAGSVTENMAIGRQYADTTQRYQGTMGDVMVYNRVLSAGEILRLHQVTKWRYV